MEKEQEPAEEPREPSGSARPADAPGAGDGAERDEAVGKGGDVDTDKDKEDKEKEKEEEEAFLVSLYKFMKERRTPIERIPHLGFKQINLWKIYKAVEKLGAYELVTGRRLWKNVYDELGGSPGSTSAATCTRRHYERLVLPYVRHLKGEEDKPLPPSKPRRQYKVSRDDKSKRGRKEKGREQVAPDKGQPEPAAEERRRGTDGRCSPSAAPSPSAECPGACRSHGETYERLFSSFYSKGNHPIMSPLAKKKLLAQVSEAESLRCHKRHCPEARRAPSDSGPEPPRPSSGPRPAEQSSPEAPGTADRAPSAGSEAAPARSASPAGTDSPGPAVFTGYFHAYRSEGLAAGGCPPLWGCFPNLKDFLEPLPARPEEPERPQELRSGAGRPRQGPVRPSWASPGARAGRRQQREDEDDEDDEEEDEDPYGLTAKSRSVSPRAEERSAGGSRLPGAHRGLPKPRAVVAAPAVAPPPPAAFPGAALRFPGGAGPKALPLNPLLIPAFPSPLLLAAGRFPASYGSSPFPAEPWQRSRSSPHVPAFPHRP
ncbi:AT-rich interactive domain-containing protein 5A [Sylvia atricapilla]|uniref:AT-rich interactive domain-containing protein 5A n=1 Tax=Sylvia atricapilla TaxID=48155 RepID=UPI0033978F87